MFSLISESRFNVHVPYDAKLIELFKQVPSRMYGEYIVCNIYVITTIYIYIYIFIYLFIYLFIRL